jgi:hypothetical protein
MNERFNRKGINKRENTDEQKWEDQMKPCEQEMPSLI